MHKLLGSIINKFDAEAKNHMERQSLNPFSGSFSSRSPSPRLSKDQYGKPLAGSKTEERGQKAKCHILREILDLCSCIHDMGVYNKTHKPKDDDDSDEEQSNDEEIIITFGEIFQMYTKINDKVVGLLIAAKKRGFLFFDKEILFQRRDDDVLIALIKPIAEIRAIITKELAINSSPVPPQSKEASRAASPSIVSNNGGEKENKKVVKNAAIKKGSKSPDKQVTPSSAPSHNDSTGTLPKVCNGTAEKELKDDKANDLTSDIKKDDETLNVNNTPKADQTKAAVNSVKSDNQNIPEMLNAEAKGNVTAEPLNDDSINKINDSNGETVSNAEIPVKVSPNRLNEESIPTIIIKEVPTIQQNSDDVASMETEIGEVASEQTIKEITSSNKGVIQEAAAINESGLKTKDESSAECAKGDQSENVIPVDSNMSLEETGILANPISSEQNEEILSANPPKNISITLNDTLEESDALVNGHLELSGDLSENEFKSANLSAISNESPEIMLEPQHPCEHDRKRTLTNEELMESLTAALSEIGSSPDTCDEEVELILQSHNAASDSILSEPKLDVILEKAIEINDLPQEDIVCNINGEVTNVSECNGVASEEVDESKSTTEINGDLNKGKAVSPNNLIVSHQDTSCSPDDKATTIIGEALITSSPEHSSKIESSKQNVETNLNHDEKEVSIESVPPADNVIQDELANCSSPSVNMMVIKKADQNSNETEEQKLSSPDQPVPIII